MVEYNAINALPQLTAAPLICISVWLCVR